MFRDISTPLQNIALLWCNAVLYGVNVVSTGICVRLLWKRAIKRNLQDNLLLLVVMVQFALATVSTVIFLVCSIRGFVNSPDPSSYFYFIGRNINFASSGVYFTNNLIADGILVWRLYIVWGRNPRIYLPFIIILVASIISTYVALGLQMHQHSGTPIFAAQVKGWITAVYVFSLTIQVSATVLIAWRIWSTHINNLHNDSMIVSVMWIVLESGMVLSTAVAILLAFYLLEVIAGGVLQGIIVQLDTLVPTSIVIRGMTVRESQSTTLLTASSTRSQGNWPIRFRRPQDEEDIRTGMFAETIGGLTQSQEDEIYELQRLKNPSLPEAAYPRKGSAPMIM